MGDLLRQGSQWLEQQRAAHCSSRVTYRRGDQEQALSATFGRTQYEVQDDFGLVVAVHVTDFLVAAADFAPVFGEPQPGDRIVADLPDRQAGGYAHRLRAVGHLFEAEDESQQWPDLHAALRQARKAYQSDGTVPDWASLEALLGDVRRAE